MKNHWTQPYSSHYVQFGLKEFHVISNERLGDIEYCVIPGKNEKTDVPIVLVQGMGLGIQSWSLDFLKTLDDFTLYLIDPIESFEMANYAESVYEVTKQLSTFFFVGYSFGSFVIQQYMSLFPTKPVQKIVFVAGGDLCAFKLYDLKKTGLLHKKQNNDLILRQGIATIKARISKENCFLQESESSDIPILLIRAENDNIFLQDYLFCGKNEITVKHVNHNLLETRPIFVANTISTYLLQT